VIAPPCNSGWLDVLRFDADGLIPAIAQDAGSGRVIMFAFMNRESLQASVQSGHAVYWSRSRQRLWHKGEESGHRQRIVEWRTDCDADVILLRVEQVGGIACHTGRESCFFNRLEKSGWQAVDPVLKDASEIYSGKTKS
jgi:phosphoribosyl-AMP cyclohydrolase